MSQEPQPSPGVPPPHVQLIQMATGYWISKILYVAAKLQLADRLAEGPKNADELAAATGAHAPSVHRLLRTLASLGVFTERDGLRFALTPLGEALRKGAPGSAHPTILTLAGPTFYRAWDEALYSFETGKTAFEKVFGMISGVVFVLFGEAMMLRSVPHAGWALAFLVINLVFIPLFEEPGLEARFGEPYREYVRKVPRILPRLRPWKPDAPADADRSPG